MAIIESQIEVTAAWLEAKHGHSWWPTRGHDDLAGTKHDRLWYSIRGRDKTVRVHLESKLDGSGYGRGSGWSEDVMPHLPCQHFRSRHFVFRRHMEHREAACLSRYGTFNARATCPFIIRVRDILSGSDRNCWFKFLKRSLIPVVDLVFKPLTIDFY